MDKAGENDHERENEQKEPDKAQFAGGGEQTLICQEFSQPHEGIDSKKSETYHHHHTINPIMSVHNLQSPISSGRGLPPPGLPARTWTSWCATTILTCETAIANHSNEWGRHVEVVSKRVQVQHHGRLLGVPNQLFMKGNCYTKNTQHPIRGCLLAPQYGIMACTAYDDTNQHVKLTLIRKYKSKTKFAAKSISCGTSWGVVSHSSRLAWGLDKKIVSALNSKGLRKSMWTFRK